MFPELPDAEIAKSQRLAALSCDFVVIGGGLRIPPKSLLLSERLLNSIH